MTQAFPFPPNWSSPFTEFLEWKTDVIRSRDGTEQRRGLRETPRRGFDYSIMLKDQDPTRLEALLWGQYESDFYLPVWSDGRRTTAVSTSGTTSIEVSTVDRSFSPGHFAILYKNSTTFEVVQIDSMDVDEITTVDPLVDTWPQGTRVYPVVLGRLPQQTPTQRYTSTVLVAKMTFSTSPEETYDFLPDEAAPATYDGLEVLTVPPNWKAPINNDFTRRLLVADSGVGPVKHFDTGETVRILRPFEWFLKSHAQVYDFRAFIRRRHGQLHAFWTPSWHGDFRVSGTSAAVDAELTVAGTEFATHVGLDTSRDRIRVVLNDGTIFYRQITDVDIVSNDTVLTLNDDFGVEVSPSNVRAVNLMLKCRLAGDRVEIPWLTDGVTTPQLTFMTVNA